MKKKNKKIDKFLSKSTYLIASRGAYLWFTYKNVNLKNHTTNEILKNIRSLMKKIEPTLKKIEKDVNKTWQCENLKMKFL